ALSPLAIVLLAFFQLKVLLGSSSFHFGFFVTTIALVYLVAAVSIVVSVISLWSFRCPRCNQKLRAGVPWFKKLDGCKTCGLPLEAPDDPEKTNPGYRT